MRPTRLGIRICVCVLACALGADAESAVRAAGRQGSDEQLIRASHAGFGGRLRIANKMAADLSPIADEFEAIAQGFEERVARIDTGMSCLLDLIENDPGQLAEMADFPMQLQSFVTNVRDANDRQLEFATSVAAAGKFSKPLRVSTRRIADAARRVAKALGNADIWNSRLQNIVEKARLQGHLTS